MQIFIKKKFNFAEKFRNDKFFYYIKQYFSAIQPFVNISWR